MNKKYIINMAIILMGVLIFSYAVITNFTQSYYIVAFVGKVTKEDYEFLEEIEKLEDVYNIEFDINKTYHGNTNFYEPVFMNTNYYDAVCYKALFGMDENNTNFYETDDYFAFIEGSKNLYVYKNTNLIEYKDRKEYISLKDKIDELKAIEIAKEFFQKRLLDFVYEELFIEYKNGNYYIRFINRLTNLKNFSFSNNIVLDSYGNIKNMEYYYVSYRKIGNYPIKNMREAFYSLPINFDDEVNIFLYDGQLVYVYEDDMVQPAYFFQGKMSDGKKFEAFIKAISFNKIV